MSMCFPDWYNFRVCLILQKPTVPTACFKKTLPQHCKPASDPRSEEAFHHRHRADIFPCPDALQNHPTSSSLCSSFTVLSPIYQQQSSPLFVLVNFTYFNNNPSSPCYTRSILHLLSTRPIRRMHRGQTPCLNRPTCPQTGTNPCQSIPMALDSTTITIKYPLLCLRHPHPQIHGPVTSQLAHLLS
jgi:hypothetical protein